MDAMKGTAQAPVTTPQAQPQAPPVKQEAVPAASGDSFKKTPVATTAGTLGKFVKSGARTLFTGFGLGAGGVGGFMIGGAVGASGSLISGLFSRSLTMAAASSAGMTGGIIGAVVFGACGALGGYNIVDMGSAMVNGAVKLGKWIANIGKD